MSLLVDPIVSIDVQLEQHTTNTSKIVFGDSELIDRSEIDWSVPDAVFASDEDEYEDDEAEH